MFPVAAILAALFVLFFIGRGILRMLPRKIGRDTEPPVIELTSDPDYVVYPGQEYEEEGCDTYFNKKDHLWTLYEYETGVFKIPSYACDGMIYGGCNCGNCHITILPIGDIYACRRVAESKVGNIFEDRLADVVVRT